MPRPPRMLVPNGLHHVFSRGNNRERLFWDDADYRTLLTMLERVAPRHGLLVLAYCLMPNHVHLIVRDPPAALSAAMQELNGGYSRAANRRHGRVRHLFQNRFGSVLIETDAQLLVDFAYVALNPVEAGLCRAPVEYRWSSHRALAGVAAAPPFLALAEARAYFGRTARAGALAYEAFVAAEHRRRAGRVAATRALAAA